MRQQSCKVDFTVDRYGLSGSGEYESINDWLLARWTGADDRNAVGYRTLTKQFNERVLKHVYDEHGRDTTGPRVTNEYETLTGDDDLLRREVEEDLVSDGINVNLLSRSLVSWSSMRNHLQSCLDGHKDPPTATTDWERESVKRAREHAMGSVKKAISSLASTDRITCADEASIEMPVLLSCPECPTRRPLEEALERGYVCREHLSRAESRAVPE